MIKPFTPQHSAKWYSITLFLFVDYFFILDNSCSAGPLRKAAQQGFSALVDMPDVLPKKPKITTMTTSHAQFDDLTKKGIGLT